MLFLASSCQEQRNKLLAAALKHGDVAQLARAPALQAGGQGFESPSLHHVAALLQHPGICLHYRYDKFLFAFASCSFPPFLLAKEKVGQKENRKTKQQNKEGHLR